MRVGGGKWGRGVGGGRGDWGGGPGGGAVIKIKSRIYVSEIGGRKNGKRYSSIKDETNEENVQRVSQKLSCTSGTNSFAIKQTDRDRHTQRQADRQTDRPEGRETQRGKQRQRQTNRNTEKDIDRDRLTDRQRQTD